MRLKIAFIVAAAVVLQTQLPLLWQPLRHIDLPLVVVTYFALRRDVAQSMVVGFCAGLATDIFSAGLLGAGGFTKTTVAYLIAALATRVRLDNPLVRIPVLAGAAALDAVVVVVLHRVFGQPSLQTFADTASLKLIATTAAGTLLFYVFDVFFSDRSRQRRHFAFRRRAARRSLVRR
ncbi:MAG TPA: rod shape-determining protein MreD [Pyrinomonadaceae bacterium]|jgi:rod shape-determining protein MreD